ncbi:hypothetical protein OHAE_4762 [Ochrobactrum soli]|uniref:Uncharacterized protein n=1 Tax=Ochrobactrum soli TaxID=2448455 RepID=A0A2P9HDR4_9HYPH|nr:hypothetical protein OHAE_4762 [[Ochrobactrum] soli]
MLFFLAVSHVMAGRQQIIATNIACYRGKASFTKVKSLGFR